MVRVVALLHYQTAPVFLALRDESGSLVEASRRRRRCVVTSWSRQECESCCKSKGREALGRARARAINWKYYRKRLRQEKN